MIRFYKVNTDGYVAFGSGLTAPDGYTEYTVGSEPQELLDAQAKQLINTARDNALQRISQGFINSMQNGTMLSTTIGIEVDNRRYMDKNDKDNLQSLIDLNVYPFTWVGVGGATYDILDSTTALALRDEMINDGLAKYQRKWLREQEVATADTLANPTASDYDAIVW